MHPRTPAGVFLAALVLSGCAAPTAKAPKGGDADADAEVRQAFAALQTAVKERSGEKLYDLLDSDSRQDADRIARAVKEMYAKADEKKKEELSKKVGLPATKLQDLNGKTFLESDLFFHYDEHDEIPDVKKVEKVEVKGNTAKLDYRDPDKQENMMHMKAVREDSRWRWQMGMKAPE